MLEWRQNLRRNGIYMLTGALISVFLWVAVSADRVEQRPYTAELLVINSDRGYVLTEIEPQIDQVAVEFTGPSADLAVLATDRPQIFVSIDSVESGVRVVDLTPDMVKGRGGRELTTVRAIRVRPDQLTLRFEPRAQKVVRVVPRMTSISLAEGYVIADSVRTEPGMVAVDGPENAVESIDSVLTAPVPGERLRQTISVQVPLEQPDLDGLVELSSPEVIVTVTIEPIEERVFPGIPLSVSGADVAGLRVEPSLVDVRVWGARSAVRAIRPEALLPRIELSGPADYGELLPVILIPLSPFIEVTVDPDSARVVEVEGTR